MSARKATILCRLCDNGLEDWLPGEDPVVAFVTAVEMGGSAGIVIRSPLLSLDIYTSSKCPRGFFPMPW